VLQENNERLQRRGSNANVFIRICACCRRQDFRFLREAAWVPSAFAWKLLVVIVE
jgi:hypothetical protein